MPSSLLLQEMMNDTYNEPSDFTYNKVAKLNKKKKRKKKKRKYNEKGEVRIRTSRLCCEDCTPYWFFDALTITAK